MTFLRRYWFLMALVLVFIPALLGLALFIPHILPERLQAALGLSGADAAINNRLQDSFNLSYAPPIPWWGALLLLLIPFAILILYFLKLKRKPLQVPSTFLWKKSIEDLHVNSLLQWLRENVLLLLQLFTIVVLIYAVMAFRFHGKSRAGKHYIIMIDNSASMSATDLGPNRLDWAKQEALKEIDAAGDQDFGMVIVFSSSAETRQSRTSNRDLLRLAVRTIKPTQRPTRIEEALNLADSLANPTRSTDDVAARPPGQEPGKERTYVQAEGIKTTVHLFSDGRFKDVENFALGNLSLHYHVAGNPGPANADNVGIVTFTSRREEIDPSKLHVFVSALNFKPDAFQAKVQLDVTINGKLKSVYEKELKFSARKITTEERPGSEPLIKDEPGPASATFILEDTDDRAEMVLHAKLRDHKDSFPLDDEAWLVVGVVRKARLLIVSKGNDALDNFFKENVVGPVAKMTRLTPDKLTTDEYLTPALNGEYDLVIFDRCGPAREEDMPRANTFFIGYPPPPWKPLGGDPKDTKVVEKLNNPGIKGWMHKHSVLRGLVALHEVLTDEAFKMKDLPPRTPRLLESDTDTPLLLTLNRQSFTDLVMTFAILNDKDQYNTNWPLQLGFPLFLRNVVYALGNVVDASAEEVLQPGEVKLLRPDAAVDEIEVTPPAGLKVPLQRGTRADFSFGATDEAGIYRVAWQGKEQRSFSVNLLDQEESNLEPRMVLKMGEEKIVASESRELHQTRDMWQWVVLAALLLLLLEWYIYNRRVYI